MGAKAKESKSEATLEVPSDIMMESVAEKLKLLNYETHFCQRKRPHWKPLHHLYFVVAQTTNPTEQFHYFANLVACAGRASTPRRSTTTRTRSARTSSSR